MTLPEPSTDPKPEPRLIGVYDLKKRDCRWPVCGSGADTKYCGLPTTNIGKPYCQWHDARAWRPNFQKR